MSPGLFSTLRRGRRLAPLVNASAAAALSLLLLLFGAPTLADTAAGTAAVSSEIKLLNMFVQPSNETTDVNATILALRDGFMAALYNTSMQADTGIPITIIEATAGDDGTYDDSAGIVKRALADHPDLFAVMGPPLGYQLNNMRASGVLQDNSLISWGNLYSWVADRTWWGPYAAFFGQSSEVELLVLLRYLVYDLHYRRVGYMYCKGGSVGEPKLNVTLTQLDAMGHDAVELIMYDEYIENGFNQTMFDAYADQKPQVTLVMGQGSAHVQEFVTHLLTDPRTVGSSVLGITANERSINAAMTELQAAGTLNITDGQVHFADTNYLPTQDEFPHIRAFRQQMSKYIADGKSALAPAGQPLYFDDNIHLGTMMVAGWIAGAAMVQSLKTVEALTSREAFAQQVFQPYNNYLVGGDLLLGMFGGDCNAAYAQQQYAVCRCNEGGRLGVLRAVLKNMTLQPMPDQTFISSPLACYATEHFIVSRPITGLMLNITVAETASTGAIAVDMATGADAAVQAMTDAGLYSEGGADASTRMHLGAAVAPVQYDDATATMAQLHNDFIFTVVIGPVLYDMLPTSEVLLDPITQRPHLSLGYSTNIYITPTLQQQAYVCYSNIRTGLQDGSLTSDQSVFIIQGIDADQEPDMRAMLDRTADTFDMPRPIVKIASSSDDIASLLPDKGAVLLTGTTVADVQVIYDHLAANPECLFVFEWTDFAKRYETIMKVFSAALTSNRPDILFRIRVVTNLPMWSKGLAGAAAPKSAAEAKAEAAAELELEDSADRAAPTTPGSARDTRMAPEAFFQQSSIHTPQALEGWYAMQMLASVMGSTTTGVFGDAFLDQLYRQQLVYLDGLELGPYVRCDGTQTEDVDGQAACVPQNYGARNIVLMNGIQLFNTSYPYSTTPITPSMQYRSKQESSGGLSKGALIGIIVGSVVGGLLLIGAIVAIVVCCCVKGSARDNKNAPKESTEPVTLVFTDIESSTAMWAAVPTLMADAVTTHHSIIRQAIAKYKCYEVKTIGDSFMIACKSAFDAVSVAGTVQTAFLKRDWKTTDIDAAYRRFELEKEATDDDYRAPTAKLTPEVYVKLWNGLRVRMGIHTGLSDIRQDEVTKGFDYYGETSNMAARTEAIGNGGQVLMTETAWWALSHAERRSLNASSLGPVALRGVPYPVEMMQINAVPGRTFGPLRTEIQIEDLYKEEDDDEGASGLEQLSQATMTGASHAISAVLTSCFSPYSPAERIKGLQPVMQKWNLAVPPRPRTVSAADYAQGLINRLAIKMASVEESRRRANGHMSNTGTLKQQQMLSAARAAVAQRSLSSRAAASTTSSTFLRTGDVEALTHAGPAADGRERRLTNQFPTREEATNPLQPSHAASDDHVVFVAFPSGVEEL